MKVNENFRFFFSSAENEKTPSLALRQSMSALLSMKTARSFLPAGIALLLMCNKKLVADHKSLEKIFLKFSIVFLVPSKPSSPKK